MNATTSGAYLARRIWVFRKTPEEPSSKAATPPLLDVELTMRVLVKVDTPVKLAPTTPPARVAYLAEQARHDQRPNHRRTGQDGRKQGAKLGTTAYARSIDLRVQHA